MGNKLELLGKKFGRLTVIQEYGKDKNGKVLWECQCDCGNKTVSLGSNLVRKNGTCLSTMYGRMRKGMTPEESVINKNLKSKQIEKIDINTDDVICTYKSLRQAAKALGKNPSDISLCANGRLKTAYGYKWRFGNE